MSGHTIPNNAEPTKPLVLVNIHAITKFDGSNYQQWRIQLEALLQGYDLSSFIDGTPPPPKSIEEKDNQPVPNPAYTTWFQQDRLLFGAVASTLTSPISPILNRLATTKDAWDALASSYARPSRGHIKQLRHKLKHTTKGSSSITDYMNNIKATVDELALLGTILSQEDITDQIIEGLPSSYQTVIDAVNARDTPITFSDFHEKLIRQELIIQQTVASQTTTFNPMAHPTYTRNSAAPHQYRTPAASQPSAPPNQNPKNPFRGKCQWCHLQGHTLFYCPVFKALHVLHPAIQVPPYTRNPTAPTTTPVQAHPTHLNPQPVPKPWLLDSGASHHVTAD